MLLAKDYDILSRLSEDGGFPAGDITFWVHGERTRSGSAQMSGRLRSLEARGYVAKLDDRMPVCWRRTPKGTEALERRSKSVRSG